MSHDWIGIAENLTEHGVIGHPYEGHSAPTPSPPNTAGYPAPPKNGLAKTLLFLFGIIAVVVLAPQWQVVIDKTKHLLENSSPLPGQFSSHDDVPEIAVPALVGQSQRANSAASAAIRQANRQTNEPARNTPKHDQEELKRVPNGNSALSPTESLNSESATDTSPPAAESNIDLSTYRNLTGRI
jgi:hypothetical protein